MSDIELEDWQKKFILRNCILLKETLDEKKFFRLDSIEDEDIKDFIHSLRHIMGAYE